MNTEPKKSAISEEQKQLALRLNGIFMPTATKKRLSLYENPLTQGGGARFVHYTTADAALKIIKSKRLWMRNTTCMSDYREVQHGCDILLRYFSDKNKKQKFFDALDASVPGAAQEAITLFDQWWADIRFNTFILSISEHDKKEDSNGRLSMWRAFGNNTARVAIIFNVPWESSGADLLKVTLNPVSYLTEPEVNSEIGAVIENARANIDFLRSLDRTKIVGFIYTMLVNGVTCQKHEGFHEEREWRVIYAPRRWPSPLMESSTEVIGGVPQIVYKLPIDEKVSGDISDLDISKLFDRLIIGPSMFPSAMHEAFTNALTSVGVVDAGTKVVASNIPIRT